MTGSTVGRRHARGRRREGAAASFATLTATGYGDTAPLDPYTRRLANVEAIIGQLYPATLLARLVTLELVYDRGS